MYTFETKKVAGSIEVYSKISWIEWADENGNRRMQRVDETSMNIKRKNETCKQTYIKSLQK